MSLIIKFKKLKKPSGRNPNIFNSVKLSSNSNHLIGVNYQGLVTILISSTEPKGKGESLTNLIIKHRVFCTVKLNNKKSKKMYSIIKCLSNNENTQELFLMSLENIVKNITKTVSEKKIDELTKKLIKLFEKISANKDYDIMGLWGELFTIDYLKSTETLLNGWHNEKNDLFDFFVDNTALETKTTTRNDRKHIFSYDQLNSKNLKIIVCSIKLEKQRSGFSILDLKKKIEKKIKSKDLQKKLNENFGIIVANKPQREIERFKYSYKYAKDNISFYDSLNVPRIKETPMYGLKKIKFESNLDSSESITNFSEYKFLK